MSSVRAKMLVQSVKKSEAPYNEFSVSLRAVYKDGDPENEAFFAATPAADVNLHVVRPEVAEKFQEGKFYYVDFTPVE